MGGSSRPRLRSEISCGDALGDLREGTSARTRPLSYDEIMQRRKSKKEPEVSREEIQGAESTRTEEVNNLDHHRSYANVASMKHSKDLEREANPRKKKEKSSREEDAHRRSNNKESLDVETRAKHRHERDVRSSTEASRTDRRGHVSGKLDDEFDDMAIKPKQNYEKNVRTIIQASESDRQGHLSGKVNEESHEVDGRSKHKHEEDMNNTAAGKASRRGHTRGKQDEESQDFVSRSKHKDEKEARDRTNELISDRQGHVRRGKRDEESQDVVSRSKHKYEKDARDRTKELTNDRQGHVKRGKQDEESQDLVSRSNHKDEKDVRDRTKELYSDRRDHVRSKLGEHSRAESKSAYEDKHRRDSLPQDRYMERGGEAFDREKKRRTRNGDNEKHGIRDLEKKHDGGSKRDSDTLETKDKMEFSHLNRDGNKSKRRRSRSQDRVRDKSRRSRSPSPKVWNNVSRDHDRGLLLSHTEKEKSRHYSDAERSKMSTSGSTSHHRRQGGTSSGLGGYSPRKRKSEAAIKTPSPIRSPEQKNVGWDLPHSGSEKNVGPSVASASQLVSQNKSSNMIEFAAGFSVASSMGEPLSAIFSSNLSAFKEASIDSVQLTQATRPMRRLYIDNIPASASDKDIMDFFNNILLSFGSNRIRGTRPCISCMIHKEKRQALVEFLTPEDASAALSFNGKSLSGSILKIRRPKDFVEVTSGFSERPKAIAPGNNTRSDVVADDVVKDIVVSDVVKDSPHKIFIGGIAEGLSSKMIMEIISVFGPLKAFHFEINGELNKPCAFVEYADQSITLKACAGLNGMKLGGRVLTVAQAVPSIELLENSDRRPFYGVPEYIKPLLETPTQVLKLSNVLNQNAMDLLSETDFEEIVEDVRLECSRFGSVVSINVVKSSNLHTTISGTESALLDAKPIQPLEEREYHDHHLNVDVEQVDMDHVEGEGTELEPSVKGDDHDLAPATANWSVEGDLAGTRTVEVKDTEDSVQSFDENEAINSQMSDTIDDSAVENTGKTNVLDANCQDHAEDGGTTSEMELTGAMGIRKSDDGEDAEDVRYLDATNGKLPEDVSVSDEMANSKPGASNIVKDEHAFDVGYMFEVGCILVEFRRPEASCMAAHCLHGRVFDDRIVAVNYVPLEAYRAKFPK